MGGPIHAPSPLFPEWEERRAWEDFLTSALADARERVRNGAVGPDRELADLQQELDGLDFHTPQPLSTLLPWVIDQLEHGVVHMTHPRYFGPAQSSPVPPGTAPRRRLRRWRSRRM